MMNKVKLLITELVGKPVTSKNGKQYALFAWETINGDYILSYVPAHKAADDSWEEDEVIDITVQEHEINPLYGYNLGLYEAAMLAEVHIMETDPRTEGRAA